MDPSFHFNTDPDTSFHLNADPDPDLYQGDATTGLENFHGYYILSLHASIVSVHGHPWLQFEPPNFLHFDFNAETDPASQNNADPYSPPCFWV